MFRLLDQPISPNGFRCAIARRVGKGTMHIHLLYIMRSSYFDVHPGTKVFTRNGLIKSLIIRFLSWKRTSLVFRVLFSEPSNSYPKKVHGSWKPIGCLVLPHPLRTISEEKAISLTEFIAGEKKSAESDAHSSVRVSCR